MTARGSQRRTNPTSCTNGWVKTSRSAWECSLRRSASATAWVVIQGTRSVRGGIPTEDRGNEGLYGRRGVRRGISKILHATLIYPTLLFTRGCGASPGVWQGLAR